MSDADLVFSLPPAATADLVFGDDEGGGTPDLQIFDVVGQLPGLGGGVVARLAVGMSIAGVLPALGGGVVVDYVSNTPRPLVARASVRWQDAGAQPESTRERWQDAGHLRSHAAARWQDAIGVFAGSDIHWRDADRSRRDSIGSRYQDADRLQFGAQSRFQDAQRVRRAAMARFQDGMRLHDSVQARYQDAIRGVAGQHRTRYQAAIALHACVASIVGTAMHLPFGVSSRYQEAVQPKLGRTVLVPPEPPVHVCYVPDTDLVFDALWAPDAALVFVCEEGEGPGPEPGETVVVPVRRIYTVINSATLRRVDGDVLIPTYSMSLSIDVESWTWGFNARVPGSALPDLEPGPSGEPVELQAVINGAAYRAIVEGLSRERVYGRSDLVITGRGRAAVLDAPYTPTKVFGNPTGAMTVQQLANDVLTLNGAPLGWDVDTGWEPDDWLVPAGVFSHQGTYISALNTLAAAAGAYLQPHPTDKAFYMRKRYPAKPWEWGDVTPDYELPADVVQREAISWVDKPVYNQVHIRGVSAGKIFPVKRDGTAGDVEAPMIVDPLMTDAIGGLQRAMPILCDVGRQAAVTLRLPVLAETGIVPPGKFVRYVDGGVTRIGIVRSTSAEVERGEETGLSIWQTMGVETHV